MSTVPDTDSFEPVALKARLLAWLPGGGRVVPRAADAGEGRIPARWWELTGYVGLLLAAGVMRLWDLGSRAMHHDESLHAFYSWNLYNGSGYEHLPMMHGPFQFEATAAMFFVVGDGDISARLLYALLGTALIGLPFFFRRRLGRLGALLVATLLAFSPAMLYFSRFARNDILMAVWVLALVISMWRYIDEGKNRYLYLSSAILALVFATKETAYLITALLGLFLVLLAVAAFWAQVRRGIDVGQASPPVAALRLGSGIWEGLGRQVRLPEVSRSTSFLILLVTLTLPLWSAFISIFQDTALLGWSNIVLAAPEGSPHIGAPTGGGLLIAFLVAIGLLALAVRLGSLWNWPVWWRSALIFYGVWVLLYSTFFTNMNGIATGGWEALGYWVVQQGEARGGQPWYYYFVITSIYEFLPLLFGVIASVYYLRRKDVFGFFLVFWAVATFTMFTIASEKMPWLLVNLTLPLIVLTGKFLADVIQAIQWRRLGLGGGILVLPGVPVFLVLLWRLAFFEKSSGDVANVLIPLGLASVLLGLVILGVYMARRSGVGNLAALATVPVAVLLLVLTVRAGTTASYHNGDVPVEMIVYTQTSPDITSLIGQIERAGQLTGRQADVSIAIDNTSGFSWPWAWYLRDYTRVNYPNFEGSSLQQAPDASILLVHSMNQTDAEPALKDLYTKGELIRHRWWFPENVYRDMTPGKFLAAFADRQAWRDAMDYFLYRKGVRHQLGSEDSYVYFSQDLPSLLPATE